MDQDAAGYGLWLLAAANAAVFIMFAFSFARPETKRDWRSFGAFSAFVVALFAEMYGFPLTIYFLSGWLQARYPDFDFLSHDAGHLWSTLFGLTGDPHLSLLHILSNFSIAAGFIVIATAWPVLHEAQKRGELAATGLYARVRHPQYVGFLMILTGFLLQWPTILTLAMYPILVAMYVHLARREEGEARRKFGEAYERYVARVPAWIPNFGGDVEKRPAR